MTKLLEDVRKHGKEKTTKAAEAGEELFSAEPTRAVGVN